MTDKIMTGLLEVREAMQGWDVVERYGDNLPYHIAKFYETPKSGEAEANARAFVMVEQMVGALREVMRTYGSMETGDGDPCPVVANICSILARIDEDALR